MEAFIHGFKDADFTSLDPRKNLRSQLDHELAHTDPEETIVFE